MLCVLLPGDFPAVEQTISGIYRKMELHSGMQMTESECQTLIKKLFTFFTQEFAEFIIYLIAKHKVNTAG